MKQHIRTAPAIAADFLWKSVRGALIAVAVGAVGAFGGLGMAQAGIATAWIWLWGIATLLAFSGGLCFWAMNATKRWNSVAVAATLIDAPPAPAAGPHHFARARAHARPRAFRRLVPAPRQRAEWVSADTMTYWYAAAMGLLLNMLATAFLIATVDMLQAIGPHMPIGVVCNLAGYLVIIGALRQK